MAGKPKKVESGDTLDVHQGLVIVQRRKKCHKNISDCHANFKMEKKKFSSLKGIRVDMINVIVIQSL